MENFNKKIDDAVKSILALEGSANIDFIFLYGSIAQNKSHGKSDIDLCLCFRGTDEAAYDFLLEAMSAVNSDSFDLKLFRQLPLYIKIDVFKGKLLHTKDLREVYNIAYDTIRQYDEFEPRFYDYIGKEEIH